MATLRYFVRESIYLIGFMGSGKTSVGKLLSAHTGIDFVDTDKEVVQITKNTISEIFKTRGENEFRKVEASVLADIAESGKKLIVATGGGCVESAVSRGILKNCFCVWLDVDAKIAGERLEDSISRPMFQDVENAESVLKRRNPLYEQYSDLKINTKNKSIAKVCDEILSGLLKAGVLKY